MRSLPIVFAIACCVAALDAPAQSCGGGGCDPLSNPFCFCDAANICQELSAAPDGTLVGQASVVHRLAPIVINLGGGPWQLTGLDDPVQFDIQGDGMIVAVGWTARDSKAAFLAFDRNGNGVIDDASELFGNKTPLPTGERAANGFQALAQYDANGDGVIDRDDPIWTSLLLWIDSNHDGISQPDELIPISASPITAIELQHRWSGRYDRLGNRLGYEGVLRRGAHRQAFFDIVFAQAE